MQRLELIMPNQLAQLVKQNKHIQIGTITYRQYWIYKIMNFLKLAKVLNKNYFQVDKFILVNADLNSGIIKFNDLQISKRIHIGRASVGRAVRRMMNIIVVKNKKPFIQRKRSGVHGKNSYLKLNPVILPKGHNYNQKLLVMYKGLSLKDEKRKQLHTQLKNQEAKQDNLKRQLKLVNSKIKSLRLQISRQS